MSDSPHASPVPVHSTAWLPLLRGCDRYSDALLAANRIVAASINDSESLHVANLSSQLLATLFFAASVYGEDGRRIHR